MTERPRTTVIWDLGGVLIDWDPRHVYRDLFAGDDAGMEGFLAEVTSSAWNHQMDAGRPWADAVAELVGRHPEHQELIETYQSRWPDMLRGEVPGTVAVLADLRDAGARLLALTNWSAETFPVARRRFAFLGWFEGIVVSGEERLAKPDPALYRVLIERFRVDPARALYIDDRPENVTAAEGLGMAGHVFRDARSLREDLVARGLLAEPGGQPGAADPTATGTPAATDR